mmetsp:Transcript_22254/g.50957  ORF Transcript_22254/g.50957 Transcript_22254/m.50957 type:complete len:227 (-) Transcript_22254:506-1186(-)
MSPILLVLGSNPLAQLPTTAHTPSGTIPCLCCREMGDPFPIASSTRRHVAVFPSPRSTAAPADSDTTIPSILVFSNTIPPSLRNCAAARSIRREGDTPRFRTPAVYVSYPVSPLSKYPPRNGVSSRFLKPDLHPGNSVVTASSTSCCVNIPNSTNSKSSFMLIFHSCARPCNAPPSTTSVRMPRLCSAAATKIPRVPPQTIASYSGLVFSFVKDRRASHAMADPFA